MRGKGAREGKVSEGGYREGGRREGGKEKGGRGKGREGEKGREGGRDYVLAPARHILLILGSKTEHFLACITLGQRKRA